ncbi:amidohydrolase [Chitinophaga lutea]|uniref:Amidohydrolase n=1 Tax=Chitinophaga lutea TaxID=2488634 RepID=A0A3N4PLJ5_9BACT|nr:amidohydrolase family protein [Chitinophaga lutea]RPE09552.1 amidohydrolase [Chitinophaga lutea]
MSKNFSRREFIAGAGILLAGSALRLRGAAVPAAEQIIDIHQHISYMGRSDADLMFHQRALGVTRTIMLPSGTPVKRPSTHDGKSNGLQAKAGGNEACYQLAQQYPKELLFGANEVPDLPGAKAEIEKYLKLGAVVIGELKFGVDCDSKEMQAIYELAQAYNVPVLMHWQFNMYNYGFDRFYKMLEKYPKVIFVGHAQTWWANVDKKYTDQQGLYPKGKITPGGITDRLLSDYPNVYADLSAGSGLNSITRDEEHAQAFLNKHQNKLMYGSDCLDTTGQVKDCSGAGTLAEVRKLVTDKTALHKILYKNAQQVFRL